MCFFCSILFLRVVVGMNRILEGGMILGIFKVIVVRECKLFFELIVIGGGVLEWNRLKFGNFGILIVE